MGYRKYTVVPMNFCASSTAGGKGGKSSSISRSAVLYRLRKPNTLAKTFLRFSFLIGASFKDGKHGYGIYDVENDKYEFVDLENPKPFLSFKLHKLFDLYSVSQQRELFYNFITWYNAKPNKNKEKMIYTDTIEEYLKL